MIFSLIGTFRLAFHPGKMILTLTKADSREQPSSHKVEMHVEKHRARSFVTLINEGRTDKTKEKDWNFNSSTTSRLQMADMCSCYSEGEAADSDE